jgi:hypothetical protein
VSPCRIHASATRRVCAVQIRQLLLPPIARCARITLLKTLSCDLTKVPQLECDRTKA